MLVDPEAAREARLEADATGALPQIAKHRSLCPHCLVTIMPGDSIVLRANDVKYAHESCADFMDRIEADPIGEYRRQLAEFRLRQCGPRARRSGRKRKARA